MTNQAKLKVAVLLLAVLATNCTINQQITIKYEKQKKKITQRQIEKQENLLHSIKGRYKTITMSAYTQCIDIRRRKIKGVFYDFPCGQCGNCRQRKKIEWTTRLELQWMDSISCHFINLDYATEHLKFDTEEKRSTLHFEDLQKFFKLLRYHKKQNNDPITRNHPIKYFAVGEYGKRNTQRPHYHIILFNCDKRTLEKLPLIWKNGQAKADKLKDTSAIKYTMKYCFKSLDDSERNTRPQARMSRNLGLDFLKKNPSRVENGLINMGSYKIPIPKSFRNKFYHPTAWHYIKSANEKTTWENYQEEIARLENNGEQYPEEWIQSERRRKSKDIMYKQNKISRL